MSDRERYTVRKANLHITPEMDEQVRSFRFSRHINTEAEAIRELIRLGLEASKQDHATRDGKA